MLRYLRGTGKHMKGIWWVLIITTVVTFVGGFVFLFGAGLGTGRARATGAVATVNGEAVSREDFTNAVNEQRTAFSNRFGEEPGERDMKALESQAFRGLVMQRLYNQVAKKLGLAAHDHEVVLTLQTSPPQALLSAPAFQTNGKFDSQKYQAAMRDPNNNWAPFEQMVRDQLPVRKLQERLFTSVKLTEAELRDYYRDRAEKLSVSVVLLSPPPSARQAAVSDVDLHAAYAKYKGRFVTGAQRQLEVLLVPKKFGDAEVKSAQDLANDLVRRARAGESFMTLSREHSDAPGADRGGVIDRVLSPSDFGPQLAPKVALLDTGQVTDPIRDGGRFLFFKVLEKTVKPGTTQPGVRVAQIIIQVKGNEEQLKQQQDDLDKLRSRAQHDGLGHMAATQGLSTTKTAYFDLANPPQDLAAVPEAADWAFGAKLHQVSPVLQGVDAFALVQLVGTKEAGPMAEDQLGDPLRQLALLDRQVDALKPQADALAAALKSGQTLEQAAAAQGLKVDKIDGLVRAQPDPRLMGDPELVGALFAAQPGQVVGPVRGVGGFAVGRLDQRTAPDWAVFDQQRQQMAQQVLESRQQTFLQNYTAALRSGSSVKDLRADAGY